MDNSGKIKQEKSKRKYDNTFYKIMAEALGEEIFVTDGEGRILFVNPASVKTIGLPVDQIVGKSAQDLEDEGYFSKSCSMEVIRTRKQVDMIQKLKDGRSCIATGVPIFDRYQEEIIMIVTTSKDVDAVNQLLNEVEEQKVVIEKNKEEIENLRRAIFESEGFITKDVAMKEMVNALTKIAPLDVAVLVLGESGVGKEVTVRTLHKFSNRKDGPLVKINCGTIPENLIESELFGYEGGAFTGAEKAGKKGKVEMAEGGTLFLDEIGELPLSMQVKLLDLLQDGTYSRVGGTERLQINTRIVAATNRDLKKMCQEGKFREDLYYRLNVIPVNIPPLRERPGDIEFLSKHFLTKYNTKYRCNKTYEKGCMKVLLGYEWPGNVRELEHVVERTFILADGDKLLEEELSKIIYGGESSIVHTGNVFCVDLMPLKAAKLQIEKQLVTRAYQMYKSTYKVADVLQIDQSTVVKLLHKHNADMGKKK